jgi:hypothetical protein
MDADGYDPVAKRRTTEISINVRMIGFTKQGITQEILNWTYLRVEKALKDVGYIFRRFENIAAAWGIVDGKSFSVFTRVERKADKGVVRFLHELVDKQLGCSLDTRFCRARPRARCTGDFTCRLFGECVLLDPRALGSWAGLFGFDCAGVRVRHLSGGFGSTSSLLYYSSLFGARLIHRLLRLWLAAGATHSARRLCSSGFRRYLLHSRLSSTSFGSDLLDLSIDVFSAGAIAASLLGETRASSSQTRVCIRV